MCSPAVSVSFLGMKSSRFATCPVFRIDVKVFGEGKFRVKRRTIVALPSFRNEEVNMKFEGRNE